MWRELCRRQAAANYGTEFEHELRIFSRRKKLESDMSTSPSPQPDEDDSVSIFLVQFIYHIPSAVKPGAKSTGKTKKEAKSKEVSFVCHLDNYVNMLQAFLAKFSEQKYTVTAQRHFKYKYHHPGRAYVLYSMFIARTDSSTSFLSEREMRLMSIMKLNIEIWSRRFRTIVGAR
jgi:hypothetical protein